MSLVTVVASREFMERVRTKWFIAVTLLGPALMVALVVVPAMLAVRSIEDGVTIDVVDRSRLGLLANLEVAVNERSSKFILRNVDPDLPTGRLLDRVASEEIDGFLEIPADVLDSGTVTYRGDNSSNMALMDGLRDLVHVAVFANRAQAMGLTKLQVATLAAKPEFTAVQTTGGTDEKSGPSTFVAAYAAAFVLYMAILLYAVNVLRSVTTEKGNRVVEIVVASVKPSELLAGKVMGIAGVGLLQLGIWAGAAWLLIRQRGPILGLFGVEGAAAFDVPSVTGGALALLLMFFLLGFLFYAALYAAVGAMVNSEQEAQQAQAPLMVLLIVPMACVQIVAGNPRGGVAQWLSQVPFTSPIVMPLRFLLDAATAPDVVMSMVILLISLFGALYVGAKIYRIGILMYGKRPTVSELWRWLRA